MGDSDKLYLVKALLNSLTCWAGWLCHWGIMAGRGQPPQLLAGASISERKPKKQVSSDAAKQTGVERKLLKKP